MNMNQSPNGVITFANTAGGNAELMQTMQNIDDGYRNVLRDNQDGQVFNNEGTLRYDDYKLLTGDVEKAREFANVGTQDLMAAGLTRPASLSDTFVQYEDMNTFDAMTSMDASNRTSNQTNYAPNYVPLPITHTDFQIPWRQESFDYKRSDSIDEAVFRVAEERDKVLFLGKDLGIVMQGQVVPLYGYTNHPSTISAQTAVDWADPANTDVISKDAVSLCGQMFTDARGMAPDTVQIYVANDVWTNLENDNSSAKGDNTIAERIMKITCVKGIKPQKDLPDGAVCFVEMRSRTVRLALAQDIVAAPWVKGHRIDGGKFTVFGAQVAMIKTDRSGRTGILYATKP